MVNFVIHVQSLSAISWAHSDNDHGRCPKNLWETMHFQLLNRTRPAIAFQLAVTVYHELYPKHGTDVREERDMQSKIHMQILNLPHVQAAARGVARASGAVRHRYRTGSFELQFLVCSF